MTIPHRIPVTGAPGTYITKPSLPEDPEVELWAQEAWVQLHEKKTQPAVLEALKAIHHVGQLEFISRLGESIGDACKRLASLYKEGFDPSKQAVVLVENHKSNQWVAEVALHHFGFSAEHYASLGSKDARDFVRAVETDSYTFSLKDRVIVLYDDASFSGTQLHDHVRAIQAVATRTGIQAIAVVAPFMTPHAKNRIQQLGDHPAPLVIAGHQTIPTISTLSAASRTVLETLWRYTPRETDEIGLVWFSHKVPNAVSFPRAFSHGSVYLLEGGHHSHPKSFPLIPNLIPIYKREGVRSDTRVVSPELRVAPAEAPPAHTEIQEISSMQEMVDQLAHQTEGLLIVTELDTLVDQGDCLAQLQKTFPVFGCTTRRTDQMAAIDEELTRLGIALGTQEMRESSIHILFGDTHTSMYHGILYADPSSQGMGVATQYLCSLSKKPARCIAMAAHQREELEDVRKQCVTMGIRFPWVSLTLKKRLEPTFHLSPLDFCFRYGTLSAK